MALPSRHSEPHMAATCVLYAGLSSCSSKGDACAKGVSDVEASGVDVPDRAPGGMAIGGGHGIAAVSAAHLMTHGNKIIINKRAYYVSEYTDRRHRQTHTHNSTCTRNHK